MKYFIVLSMLISIVFAQHGGYGISKSTWGSSDPQKCAAWFAKYLPAIAANDSCPNGICTCAVQGRYQLDGIGQQGPGGFGIHTINCTHHPYGEHSLADIEGQFQEEWGNFSKFHPLMDYNAGFWAQNLDEYIEKFQKDNVPMTTIRWPSDDGNIYYSILVNPCGFVVLEIMGETLSDKYHDLFTVDMHMRMSMKNRNNMPNTASTAHRLLRDTSNYGFNHGFGPRHHNGPRGGNGQTGPPGMGGSSSWTIDSSKVLYPLKISRATKNLDAVKKFYSKDIGVTQVHSQKYADGSELAIFTFDVPSDVAVQLHFWQDRKSDKQAAVAKNGGQDPIILAKESSESGNFNIVDNKEFTVGVFEQFLNKTHRDIIKSNICGFDQWVDNHYAYDGAHGQQTKYLDDYAKHFEAQDLPYRWWADPRGHVLYGVDPTGWGIQFDGQALSPPSNAPQYKATCESDDGCAGQGNCAAPQYFKFLQ